MSIINWEVVKPALWTGVGGVVVGMFLLSYGFGFGFVSRPTAEQLASTNSEKAPVCAESLTAAPCDLHHTFRNEAALVRHRHSNRIGLEASFRCARSRSSQSRPA
jgi:hypothetical protein